MKTPQDILFFGLETHSTEKIREALAAGVDPRAPIDGKPPLTWLLEMYLRSPRFSDCVRCLLDAGAPCPDAGLRAVLLDDTEQLSRALHEDPSLLRHRVTLRCAFTPLEDVSLLHVAAEFGLVRAAATLLDAGIDVDARAAMDDRGLNGHTPIFHTLCQHQNHSQPVLRLLLKHRAETNLRLSGITWGKTFEWETTLFDTTPFSYAQAGLLPQFGRDERDVYANIALLAEAAGRRLPADLNVPNRYLHPRT